MEFDQLGPVLRPRGHRDAAELSENKSFFAPAYPLKVENDVSQYIVWNPESSLPPRVIHADRPTAIKVAGRMAHESPGKEFFVCKLVNSAKKPLPVEVDYKDLADAAQDDLDRHDRLVELVASVRQDLADAAQDDLDR